MAAAAAAAAVAAAAAIDGFTSSPATFAWCGWWCGWWLVWCMPIEAAQWSLLGCRLTQGFADERLAGDGCDRPFGDGDDVTW